MKYANNRLVFRRGGCFCAPPSLAELGYDVNDQERACRACGEKSVPVLVSGTCCHCGTERAFVSPDNQ